MTPGSPATSEMAGRTCPYCRVGLEQGAEVIACPVCEAVHHGDCWEENGGCAVALCAGGPSRGDARQEDGQGEEAASAPEPATPSEPAQPLPVVIAPDPAEAPTRKRAGATPPSPPPPGGQPPLGAPAPSGASRAAWVPLIAVLIVLLGGAGAAAIVLAGNDDDSSSTASAGVSETESESDEFEAAEFEEELGEEEFEDELEEEELEVAETSAQSSSESAQEEVQRALQAHFNRLTAGHYETAYYDLTASEGEDAGGEAAWAEAQAEDQLQSFDLTVETSLLDPHTAQATIVEFETRALATGCNRWSGYWDMRKIYGEWLINEAKLEKEPC